MTHRLSLRIIFFSIGLILLLTLLLRIGNAQTAPNQSRTPVLVELFTSEGCSSCPPADALLAKLSRDQPVASAQIIILGEHVDYWDHLGWRDRFSSAQYTERQRQYGSRLKVDDIYTPQMVVNGSEQFVGNDAAHALRAIAQASHTAKLSLSLSRPTTNGRRITSSDLRPDAAPANSGRPLRRTGRPLRLHQRPPRRKRRPPPPARWRRTHPRTRRQPKRSRLWPPSLRPRPPQRLRPRQHATGRLRPATRPGSGPRRRLHCCHAIILPIAESSALAEHLE